MVPTDLNSVLARLLRDAYDTTNEALQVNIVAGTTGATEYTEDVATPSAISGNATMVERDDALSTLTPAEGDWAALRCSSTGALWVQDANSAAILADTTAILADTANMDTNITAILADTAAMDTNIAAIAGCVGGSELQVDIVSGSASNTEYVEDAVVPANPSGIAMMMERDDALGGLTPAAGDWTHPFCDANGALWTHDDALDACIAGNELQVDVVSSALPTGAATAANQSTIIADTNAMVVDLAAIEVLLGTIDTDTGSILTAVELIDDVIYADDADWTDNTSKHMLVGGLYQSTEQSVTDGDVAPFSIDSFGRLKVSIEANNGEIPSGTNNIGDVDIASIAAGDNNIGNVDIASALPAGTNAIGKLAANSGVDIGDVDVTSITGVTMSNDAIQTTGDEAHDAVDAGNPVKVGGKAKNQDGTAPGTAVAEDDRVDFIADVYGRQFVNTIHPNLWSVSADYAAAQTNTTVKAAPGAGLKLYITDVYLSNGAVAGNVTLLDGSGGTVLWESYPGVNGGGQMNRQTPIPLTANTLLAITSTDCTTHSITVGGFIAP